LNVISPFFATQMGQFQSVDLVIYLASQAGMRYILENTNKN